MDKKVAVILCGSGFLDGSEIRESVATLWALSHSGASVEIFCPEGPQHHVVNCLTGEESTNEKREMLTEAARIARGQIKPLSDLNASQFDALILPGGFGAAKNLCDFAFKGSSGSVISELKKVLNDFFDSKKPIGAICIAPTILALHFKDKKLELTVGEPSEASQEIEKLGHKHIVKPVDTCHVDLNNKIVSTPAYMYANAKLADLFKGVEALTKEVLKLCL